jgi:hypothetical protein
MNSDRAGRLDDLAAFTPPPPGEAGRYALAGLPQGLRQLMIAGGRVPAGEAGPMHVHQDDEIPPVLSGQNLIRCRDRRRTAPLARRAPLPGNPERPYPDGCG